MATRPLCAAVLVLAIQSAGSTGAEPLKASWSDLRQGRPESCAAFLENYLAQGDCAQQTLIAKLTPSRLVQCAPGHAPLDGQTITIAGYAHPLKLEFKSVKAFLLIPRLRSDCRHPPPPLPDQIISVTYPDGLDLTLDPVWITGVLRLEAGQDQLAPTSYTMIAESISPAVIPDVPETR